MRIALTVVASFLLRVPYLQVVGGVLLLWIAFKLLREEGEDARHRNAPERMLDAMMTLALTGASAPVLAVFQAR